MPPIRHENDELSADVQEAFDKLGFQVVLNAIFIMGWHLLMNRCTGGFTEWHSHRATTRNVYWKG